MLSSMLGGGHRARVEASGPNSKRPLVPSRPGSTDHDPVARLQFSCMVTVPSPCNAIVYSVPSPGRVMPCR